MCTSGSLPACIPARGERHSSTVNSSSRLRAWRHHVEEENRERQREGGREGEGQGGWLPRWIYSSSNHACLCSAEKTSTRGRDGRAQSEQKQQGSAFHLTASREGSAAGVRRFWRCVVYDGSTPAASSAHTQTCWARSDPPRIRTTTSIESLLALLTYPRLYEYR